MATRTTTSARCAHGTYDIIVGQPPKFTLRGSLPTVCRVGIYTARRSSCAAFRCRHRCCWPTCLRLSNRRTTPDAAAPTTHSTQRYLFSGLIFDFRRLSNLSFRLSVEHGALFATSSEGLDDKHTHTREAASVLIVCLELLVVVANVLRTRQW